MDLKMDSLMAGKLAILLGRLRYLREGDVEDACLYLSPFNADEIRSLSVGEDGSRLA